MAADARLSIRAQVQAEQARGTGDRRRNEYRSLSIVPSKQVRRALSTAKHLMQAIFGDRIGENRIPGLWSTERGPLLYGQAYPVCSDCSSSAIPPSRSRWECREDTLKEILR